LDDGNVVGVDTGSELGLKLELDLVVAGNTTGSGILEIGVVEVSIMDRGIRGLLVVVVLLVRGGGSREETLGGADGGDVLDVVRVRDNDDGGDVGLAYELVL
jgi:hypothetical protein